MAKKETIKALEEQLKKAQQEAALLELKLREETSLQESERLALEDEIAKARELARLSEEKIRARQEANRQKREQRKAQIQEQLSQAQQNAAATEAELQTAKGEGASTEKPTPKWHKTLKEGIENAQKLGHDLYEARMRRQQQEEYNKLVEEARARQDAKAASRTFANPQSAEEAEGTPPETLDKLVAESISSKPQPSGKPQYVLRRKTRKEIIEDGTLLEKVHLYYQSADLGGYFNTDAALTKEELAEIQASIRTPKDRELVRKCNGEYNALIVYTQKLQAAFKRFQTNYSLLAILLNKWSSYEATAKSLTTLYQILDGGRWAIGKDTEKPVSEWNKQYSITDLRVFVKGQMQAHVFEGAALSFDEDKGSFFVNVDLKTPDERGLLSLIKDEVEEVEAALADFKAYAVVAEDFIGKSTLCYMPIAMQMSIENAEEERYTRYLVKDLSFFRSELNRKKEEGAAITPEEEERAVIPDYYEVEPDRQMGEACKRVLDKLAVKYNGKS